MLWQGQAIFESKEDKLSFNAECGIQPRVSDTKSPADWMPADEPTELSRIKLKTWTRQPVPTITQPTRPTAGWLSHLALVICILLLLISMLWHIHAIFEWILRPRTYILYYLYEMALTLRCTVLIWHQRLYVLFAYVTIYVILIVCNSICIYQIVF